MSETEVVLGPEDLKRCRVECSAEEMTVRWRLGNSGPTAFLTLWLLGWSVGCGVIAHRLWTEPRPATLVFALPFWAGELFVAAMLVRYWFGRGRLHHSPSGLVISEDIGPLHHRREMASSELTAVKVGSVVEDSESKRRVPVLLLEGPDYRWNWGKGLPLVELEWIARELEDRRRRLETPTSSDLPRVPVELPVRVR